MRRRRALVASSVRGAGSFELEPYLRALTLFPLGPLNPSQAWTLRHEFLFYLVFITAFRASEPRFAWLGAWMLAPILLDPMLDRAPPAMAYELLSFVFNRLNLLFGFGFLISLAYLRRPRWFAGRVSNGMPVLSGLCGLYLVLFVLISYAHLNTADVVLAGLGASLILWVALRVEAPPARRWMDRVGSTLGDASYAIYLTHGGVISAVLGVWSRLAPGTSVHLVLLVCMAGSLGIGVLIHRYVERPLVRRLQGGTFKPQIGPPPSLVQDATGRQS